jgi:hypothetical protein
MSGVEPEVSEGTPISLPEMDVRQWREKMDAEKIGGALARRPSAALPLS